MVDHSDGPGDRSDESGSPDESDSEDASDESLPFDGSVLLIAAAKASVGPDRLPELLARVQADLRERTGAYERRFERVVSTPDRAAFLAPEGHWSTVGDRLAFGGREVDAVRRVHEEQLRRLGTERDRSEEFETALDIREAVVIGTEHRDPTGDDEGADRDPSGADGVGTDEQA